MDTRVSELAEDSGALEEVVGIYEGHGMYKAIAFRFERGVLLVTCNPDTDEIILRASDLAAEKEPVLQEFSSLTGLRVVYVWELWNHRGYLDGLQIRLRRTGSTQQTVQLEVAGSAISVTRVVEAEARDA